VGKCEVHSFDSGCDLMAGCYVKCKETIILRKQCI